MERKIDFRKVLNYIRTDAILQIITDRHKNFIKVFFFFVDQVLSAFKVLFNNSGQYLHSSEASKVEENFQLQQLNREAIKRRKKKA